MDEVSKYREKVSDEDYKVLQKIYANCCEEGECVLWQGPLTRTGLPCMRYKDKSRTTIRRVLATLKFGYKPASRVFAISSCRNKRCLAWDHIVFKDVAKVRKADGIRGTYSTVALSLTRARVARGKGKLTMQDAQEIRASTLSNVEAAKVWGVDRGFIRRIRLGVAMKDYANPFAGLLSGLVGR